MQNANISDRIVKPENCVLVFGIPTSEEEFLSKQNHPKGFSSIFFKRYGETAIKEYKKQFLDEFEYVASKLDELGLRIIYSSKLQDIKNLFNETKYYVIIIFTHWEKDAVEFADGFVDKYDFLMQIPQSFSGIIDLCMCQPISLTIDKKRLHLNYIIRYSRKKVKPYVWLSFYLILFKHLKQQNVTYLQAYENIIAEVSKKWRRKLFHEKFANIFRELFRGIGKNW